MSGDRGGIQGLPVIVLGAGRGRRMGGPKAVMMVQGRQWWECQDERLSAYGLETYWIVSEAVRAKMNASGPLPARLIRGDETAPMFASVLAGLRGVGDLSQGVFVLPVDTPAPRAEHFAAIVHADRPAHPVYRGKGGHPLYLPDAWIERELGTLVGAVRTPKSEAMAHDMRLDKLIAGNCERIAVDDPAVVVNMNEPTDVAAWLERRE